MVDSPGRNSAKPSFEALACENSLVCARSSRHFLLLWLANGCQDSRLLPSGEVDGAGPDGSRSSLHQDALSLELAG